jgi:hypothetical protein
VLFFYFVPDNTRDYNNKPIIIRLKLQSSIKFAKILLLKSLESESFHKSHLIQAQVKAQDSLRNIENVIFISNAHPTLKYLP